MKTLGPVALITMACAGTWCVLAAQTSQAPPVVDTQTIAGVQPNQLELSPRGAHVAAAVMRGSRIVMTYDGIEGPRFDAIVSLPALNKVESEPAQIISRVSQPTRVVFSPDGLHFMYAARAGQEFVVMADGKEIGRGPWADDVLAGWGFSPNGRHVYYALHKGGTTSRETWQLILDGRPEPVSYAAFNVRFSPDGEHHCFLQTIATPSGRPSSVLVIDGRPAGYPAPGQAVLWDDRTAPLFTSDGLHVYVQAPSTVPGVVDVFADGKPFMRANAVRLYAMPIGAGVVGVVTQTQGPSGQPMNFATAGSRRIPGSDCPGFTGITGVYFSADGKHWAVRCEQPSASWMMVDGKKGLDYQGVTNALFTDDGRAVYAASSNGQRFVVVGEVESDGYSLLLPPRDADITKGDPPVVIAGNHVGWIAAANPGSNDTPVVVDGKRLLRRNAVGLGFTADGSRYAVAFGLGQLLSLNVDGVDEKGTNVLGFLRPPISVGAVPDLHFRFSADNRHIAHFGRSGAANTFGIFIDGKFLPVAGVTPRYLSFTPDSRHLVWVDTVQGAIAIFVDGINVGSVEQAGMAIPESWDVGADGTVTWVCTTSTGDIKRVRIHPSAATSVDSMIAKAQRLVAFLSRSR